MIELLKEPWPWYVGGPIIALVMFLLLYFGENFGLSSNLRTLCTIGGAGKFSDFFRFKWKGQIWNLVFVLGAITGGFIATQYLSSDAPMDLSFGIIEEMKGFGIENPGEEYVPEEVFGWEAFLTWKGFLRLMLGGFFVGFGARYAGGCTSGHAISGLSNLQVPSLVAVVGFFIGGLIMTWFLIPYFF
jgi:uncharacterized membrane protein YedE/YeeE